jgi:hypothetical protein
VARPAPCDEVRPGTDSRADRSTVPVQALVGPAGVVLGGAQRSSHRSAMKPLSPRSGSTPWPSQMATNSGGKRSVTTVDLRLAFMTRPPAGCRQQQQHGRRIEQQRHDQDEPPHGLLVGRAEQRCQIAHRSQGGLGPLAFAIAPAELALDLRGVDGVAAFARGSGASESMPTASPQASLRLRRAFTTFRRHSRILQWSRLQATAQKAAGVTWPHAQIRS